MAYQVGNMKVPAKGNAPSDASAAGRPTPAPKAQAPDLVSKLRSPTPQGYGENGPNNPSSIPPGTTLTSDMAKAIAVDDEVLAAVIAHGHSGGLDWQTRVISSEQKVPTAHGHAKRGLDGGSPGGTVPSKLGATNAAPIRKPV